MITIFSQPFLMTADLFRKGAFPLSVKFYSVGEFFQKQ